MKSIEDMQRAHDCLWAFVMGEHPFSRFLPEAERQGLEPVRAAHAALDALCWVLGHDHNVAFGENLEKLRWREMEKLGGIP